MTTKELKKYIALSAGGAVVGLLLAWGIFRWEFKEFLLKSVVLIAPQVIMLTMLYLGHKETHKEEK
jgi:hypothetical protein